MEVAEFNRRLILSFWMKWQCQCHDSAADAAAAMSTAGLQHLPHRETTPGEISRQARTTRERRVGTRHRPLITRARCCRKSPVLEADRTPADLTLRTGAQAAQGMDAWESHRGQPRPVDSTPLVRSAQAPPSGPPSVWPAAASAGRTTPNWANSCHGMPWLRAQVATLIAL